jgi:5,10-methylene-tetrahydrofolate dehydrogenase/methenyl tetrahydrofolate cyclohydrolase
MDTQIIDGKTIASEIRAEVSRDLGVLRTETGIVPGLATVMVGDDPASHKYVRMKREGCADVGIESFHHSLPENTTMSTLLGLIRELGDDERVHGILIQLHLPPHLDEVAALESVPAHKDVDGFHPLNMGALAMRGRKPNFVACTPLGCIELIERSGTRIAGSQAVVLGRSSIVGIPLALLLIDRDATVTVCHSKTRDLVSVCQQADILVAAIGRAHFVQGDWIKPGATVIDVGINDIPDPSRKRGFRLVGDVDFDSALGRAGKMTPVPGGVGPLTITMLLKNTLEAARASSTRRLEPTHREMID